MADVTQQQVVEYIKGISVLELSQLVKTLESELGVSAAAPMMMGGGGGGAAKEAPAEEKTEFTVTLTEVGGNKINVIKASFWDLLHEFIHVLDHRRFPVVT